MQTLLGYLVAIALIATVVVLLVGLFGMAQGKGFNQKYNNVLMRARLITQLTTVILMLAYFMIRSG
jgi:hypothetical protein